MKFVHDSLYEKVYDGNPLTYILQDKTIIEFVRPESVARVVCLPRSDGNGIYPENRYELFYYTQEGWKSLGSKIATDYFVDRDYILFAPNIRFWIEVSKSLLFWRNH